MPTPEPTKRLTDLELEIMKVFWEALPDPLTVRAVVDRLQAGGRTLAYTTVQTMMNILKKKGVLSVRPGSGRAHQYRARVTRHEATTSSTPSNPLSTIYAVPSAKCHAFFSARSTIVHCSRSVAAAARPRLVSW